MPLVDRQLPQGARPFDVMGDGVRLSAFAYGDAVKPTIVLVHGYPDSSCVWDGVVPLLADQYHVVTYDVRGCGASDVPPKVRDYRMAHLIADLKAVIDHVSPDKPVHVVGHDWGSIQSWNAMMDESLKGRVTSYTSMSGISFDHVGVWLRKQFKTLRLGRAFGQLFRSWYFYMFHVPYLAPWAWKRGIAKRWPKMLERNEGIKGHRNPTQLKDGVNGIQLYRANFFPHVGRPNPGKVHVPVQLIELKNDPFVSPHLFSDHGQLVDDLWKREVFSAHWLPLKNPTLVARFVDEFVTHMEGGPETLALKRAKVLAKADPEKPFDGRQVFVTGAGSGIGRSAALKFAGEGADLLLGDINLAGAEDTAQQVRDLGREARAYQIDVSDKAAMEALADQIDREAGPVDIVLNNAGIGMSGGFLETSVADWERIVGINFWSVIYGGNLFAQRMVDDMRPGHIVNTASAAGFTPLRIYPAYATTKAAVLMLSECQHADFLDQG
ncbi:MAG: SDR family oxidoreductase, partial [Alphaproteobacteria bacterium]